MDSLGKGQVLGVTSAACFLTFSFALSVPPDSIQIRLAAVCLLVALQYSFLVTFPTQGEYMDVSYALMTVAFTFFWHAVDYLVILRASSTNFIRSRGAKPTLFAQYVWTPLSLLFNWRRLGTPWQISKVPPFSRHNPSAIPSRFTLILQRLFHIVLSLVALDLLSISSVGNDEMMGQRALFSRLDQVTGDELLFRAAVICRYAASSIIGVYLGYAAVTVVALSLGLSSPAECPPMFGSLSEASSVRGFWGDFYHQGLRRAICGPADAFVDHVLCLSRGTLISRYLRLTLAFAISAGIHGYGEVLSGVPSSECGHFLFFTSQAFAIMFEDAVKHLHRRAGSPLPTFLERLIGYTWVACWLFWMEPYMAYSLAKYSEPKPSQLGPILANLFGSGTK